MVKNLPANAGDERDLGSPLGLRRSPGEGKGNRLQYSCLDYPMDWGAWGWGLQSVGSQRVGHDCALTRAVCMCYIRRDTEIEIRT